MSDYTITLKRICDVYGENEVTSWFKDYSLIDYLTVDEAKTIVDANVFNYSLLAEMILNHYYFREIAFETPEMFKHFAKIKMKEIMRNIRSYNLFFKSKI